MISATRAKSKSKWVLWGILNWILRAILIWNDVIEDHLFEKIEVDLHVSLETHLLNHALNFLSLFLSALPLKSYPNGILTDVALFKGIKRAE